MAHNTSTVTSKTAQTKKRSQPGIATFKISELSPAVYNPRTISDDALAGLARSIEKFGLVEPIVVNIRTKRPTVVGGHQRLKALQSLGVAEAVCVTVSATKAEEKLLNLTLNNPQIQGEFVSYIENYIDGLSEEIGDSESMIDLRIKDLRDELVGELANKAKTSKNTVFRTQKLEPYKRTHILLSFHPDLFARIKEHIDNIIKIEGIEYEQGNN